MRRKLVFGLALTIVFLGFLRIKSGAEMGRASVVIYIKADGSIEGTNRIQRDGDFYVFLDDIYDEIVIQRNNMTIDGTGSTLQGTGSGYGFSLCYIHNVTIENTNIEGFTSGVHLNSASNIAVFGNNITENYNGIELMLSSDNTISENQVASNYFQGICVDSSFNNIFSENSITNNEWCGVKLLHSFSNTFCGNHITNNTYYGIRLHLSSNSVFSGNMLNGNKYSFDVWGHELGHFIHSVDVSNFIEGKPLYYLANQTDVVINPAKYPEVGYLALINCTNVMVEGLTLANNGQGLLLAYTNNSKVTDNSITSNDFGVWLESSFDNTIRGNTVESNDYGVWFGSSSDNVLCENNIADNRYGVWPYLSFGNVLSGNCIERNSYGVWFDSSFENSVFMNEIEDNLFGFWFCGSYNNSLSRNNIRNNCQGIQLGHDPSFGNAFFENNITNNDVGVKLLSSYENRFFRNNFVNNTMQACNYPSSCGNVWDDHVEGNYWSDYIGTDLNHDGVGESEYEIDEGNADHCPLMGKFDSFNTSLGYYVNIVSNSTIEDFEYSESNSTMRMHVSNITANQVFGFCRMRIPHALMAEPSSVTVDGAEPCYVNYTLYDDGNNRWIYFSFSHNQSKLETVIIPEFLTLIVLPVFITATLLAVMVCERKYLCV